MLCEMEKGHPTMDRHVCSYLEGRKEAPLHRLPESRAAFPCTLVAYYSAPRHPSQRTRPAPPAPQRTHHTYVTNATRFSVSAHTTLLFHGIYYSFVSSVLDTFFSHQFSSSDRPAHWST